ncbi:hypothetical protein DVS28_b0301 (plasmid) [Euzebya pacifica]|uniref:Uncharacterized protein n=1 Tax=Euzebya pacifica TaxID=1608957 RepID=A0A346Y6H4_9ACTN|nr:hypothetical protein [Euzebya pacifica]AXV10071.1 hypothetical protein DVS28_b0301 [Euzebya pacifica]
MDVRLLIVVSLAVIGGAIGTYRAVLWLLRARWRAALEEQARIEARQREVADRWPRVGSAIADARDWALAVPDDGPMLLVAAAGVEQAAQRLLVGGPDADAEGVLLEEAEVLAAMVARCRARAVSGVDG